MIATSTQRAHSTNSREIWEKSGVCTVKPRKKVKEIIPSHMHPGKVRRDT